MWAPRCLRTVANMTNQLRDNTWDTASIDRLSTAFTRCFVDFEADEDLFTDDAFFDLMPPLWRFQLVGGDAFVSQLRSIAEGPVSVEVLRVVPTADGFLVEHQESQQTPEGKVTARLVLVVRGARRAHLRRRRLLQRRLGRRAPRSSRRRGPHGAAVSATTATTSPSSSRRSPRAAEIEAARRVPRDLLDDLRASGCFSVLVPS